MRATMSELLPAVNGTMKRIGRLGHLASPAEGWACARLEASVAMTRAAIGKALGNLLGLPQALDQGAAQQEFARQLRVLGGAAQLIVVAPAHGWVALLQEPLVADGLRLRVLDRHV